MHEEHYIVDNGFRIGFFKDKESCQFGMNYCEKGVIVSKTDYDRARKLVGD